MDQWHQDSLVNTIMVSAILIALLFFTWLASFFYILQLHSLIREKKENNFEKHNVRENIFKSLMQMIKRSVKELFLYIFSMSNCSSPDKHNCAISTTNPSMKSLSHSSPLISVDYLSSLGYCNWRYIHIFAMFSFSPQYDAMALLFKSIIPPAK